jgi:integrase
LIVLRKKEIKAKRDEFKRPNGYGTCYKLSGRRRRPWIARATTGWNEDGRQIFQTIGYFEEEKDCRDALEMHRFNPVPPKADITLGELYEEWAEGKYQYVGKATADNYRAAWKYLSRYKGVKVKEIRTAHLQSVIDKCHKAKMSRSTLEKIRIVSVSLLGYAIQNDITNKNYADFIRLPKSEKVEKERFTDIEVKKLTDAAPENEWVGTVLVMIYTGMRISEMLGLTRFNIDIDAGIITGGIKTDAGKNRVIPIHPKILKYVKHWYNKEGQALICEDGKALSAKRYREKYYYPALEAAKVRKLTPHACRHTFGSLMAAAGVASVYIQKLIGHADYGTTANTYTHLEIEPLREAIGKI